MNSSTINITATITPALTQDPVTGDLLVCDSQSGDILRCDPMSSECAMELNHSDLLAASAGRTNIGMSSLEFNKAISLVSLRALKPIEHGQLSILCGQTLHYYSY